VPPARPTLRRWDRDVVGHAIAAGRIAVVIAFTAALASACNDREPHRRPADSNVPPPSDILHVASVDVVPLRPDTRLADFNLSPPAAVSVETPRGRLTARAEPAGAGPESRSFRIVVQQENGDAQTVVKSDAVNVFDMAWSRDGRMLAFCEGTLVFVAGRTGSAHLLYAGPGGSYPGACTDLEWTEDAGQLRFIQLQHARDAQLANPARVVLKLAPLPPAARQGPAR
jgi:hypothetical protein